MKNLKTIENKVKMILKKNEDARNDDMVLYLALCNLCLKDAGAIPLAEIMTQHKSLGLPSFESVSRTRRKLQARHPELAGSRPVQKLRATGEKAFIKFCFHNANHVYSPLCLYNLSISKNETNAIIPRMNTT